MERVDAAPLAASPDISIIVPARNEEATLGGCLESLSAQTGVSFEIVVVDDGSTDRTREIAQRFAGVRVISPEPMPPGWTGKNNALCAGVQQARADWLLFTDADTEHLSGSLARALDEVKREKAELLSYSPEQTVVTFAERAVMPVIFAELAARYPPHRVRENTSAIVAANGQYILAQRGAYEAVGGHAAVAGEILEDVALARLFRTNGKRVYFRYGGDAVRTRMYRNWTLLRDGWTKNLSELFPETGYLAFQSSLFWLTAWLTLGVAGLEVSRLHFGWSALAFLWLALYRRIRVANFALINNLIAISFGPPLFAYLLLRSKSACASGRVSWKGRDYRVGAAPQAVELCRPTQNANSAAGIENRILTADEP